MDTIDTNRKPIIQQNIIDAELTINTAKGDLQVSEEEADKKLEALNKQLDQFTNQADKIDYSVAFASGILSGIIDSGFVGKFDVQAAHEWGSEKTEEFVLKVAKWQGYDGDDVKKAIVYLAEERELDGGRKGFHLAADTNTMDFGGPLQHHLRDFAHHPTLIGLVFSMLTQFTGLCYGTDTSGAFKTYKVKDDTYIGKDVPQKILFGTVYWFFHLVSDVAGSGTESEGTGIPGPMLSIAKMISSTPLFKNDLNEKGNRNISVLISKLFNGTLLGEKDENGKLIPLRFDYRTELGVFEHLKKEALVVVLNEVIVRAFYMIRHAAKEITENNIASLGDLDKLDFTAIRPYGNRTVDRMITVASITFTAADTADAAIRSAIESGGNWVIFSGRFVSRFNYVGAGRATLAIVKEVSDEHKEEQLIHEKRLLCDAKAEYTIAELQDYKQKLEETLSGYLAEDITSFIEGFDLISEGVDTNDSDKVIHGNVIIQKVLGREPQFTNQEEFDDLMDSDIPLQL